MISIMFIFIAVLFGFFVYRRNAGLAVSTVIGVAAIILCMVIGFNWHPLYLSGTTWMFIIGIYIMVASVCPVWILLQPRVLPQLIPAVLHDDPLPLSVS